MTVSWDEIELLKSTAVSTMPKELLGRLSTQETQDLLTFLLTRPPHLPDYGPLELPPPRTRAEVDAVLAGAPKNQSSFEPLRIVLVGVPKDHGPDEHGRLKHGRLGTARRFM